MGVYGGFGVAADLNFYDFGVDDDGLSNFTLHALYDAFESPRWAPSTRRIPATTHGDDVRGRGRAQLRSRRHRGVPGLRGRRGVDYRILGADGAFDIGRNFSLTGSTAFLSADEASVSRISVGGEYRFGDAGPALYAEVGRLNVDEETTGFGERLDLPRPGARIAAAEPGTTSRSRGVYEAVAGSDLHRS
jgi:hypothetical protein